MRIYRKIRIRVCIVVFILANLPVFFGISRGDPSGGDVRVVYLRGLFMTAETLGLDELSIELHQAGERILNDRVNVKYKRLSAELIEALQQEARETEAVSSQYGVYIRTNLEKGIVVFEVDASDEQSFRSQLDGVLLRERNKR